MSPAPDAIIEMVRCQCKTNCTRKRCSCLASDLACTDLCICGDLCENDDESCSKNITISDDDSDDEFEFIISD